MTVKELEIRVANLERQLSALASRQYSNEIDNAKREGKEAKSLAKQLNQANTELILDMLGVNEDA